LAVSGNAVAAVIVVDTTVSTVTADAHCGLIEALQAAETNTAVDTCTAGEVGTDTIYFVRSLSGQTITFGSDLLINSGNLVIDGRGHPLIIAGTGSASAFQIGGGNVTLRGLDIRATGTGNGFTIYGSNTVVDLENCSVEGRLGINAFGTDSIEHIRNSTVVSTETQAVSDIAIRSGSSNSVQAFNSTIVAGPGVGIDSSSSSGTTSVYSSIVVGATPTAGSGTSTGGSLSFTSRAAAGLAATLAANGGPTRTLALQSGAAIDGGTCAAAPLPQFDQRYYVNNATQVRQVGAACDVGAFESAAVASTDSLFTDNFELY
jgi:hypothetical protein